METEFVQQQIAKAVGISPSHLCGILKGSARVGIEAAKRIGDFTGRKWTNYLDMEPDKIRQELHRGMRRNGT